MNSEALIKEGMRAVDSRHKNFLMLLSIVSTIFGCSTLLKPPLHIVSMGKCVVLDFQHFGEYVAEISEITLRDRSTEQPIWSATVPDGKVGLIATLELCVGQNPIEPTMRGDPSPFRCHTPNNAASFDLKESTLYTIEFVDRRYRRKGGGEFKFDVHTNQK